MVGDLITNYETGVAKIESTEVEVTRMKEELTALQPKLVQATEDNKIMLANLTKKRKEADAKKSVCEAE
jgi:dynein heavy chain